MIPTIRHVRPQEGAIFVSIALAEQAGEHCIMIDANLVGNATDAPNGMISCLDKSNSKQNTQHQIKVSNGSTATNNTSESENNSIE